MGEREGGSVTTLEFLGGVGSIGSSGHAFIDHLSWCAEIVK
jgi:hypothetical protein